MKYILLTTLTFIFFINFSFSQVDESDLVSQVNKQADELKNELEKQDYNSNYEKRTVIRFKTDTFKIEKSLALRLENDFTTLGMTTAIYDAEKAYDILLKKYYKMLLTKFNEKDKAILNESQQNWIKFRDSELQLNILISVPEYSGGGTIQSLYIADSHLEITKKRVIEFYNYITRFFEF